MLPVSYSSGISLKGLIPIDFSEDLPVSLWDMDSLRIVGLQKIDILGLRNLSLLKEMTQGKEPWESPACDSNTYETLGSGYTTGIFQLEAPYATKIIRSVKPSSLRDLLYASH